jgi:hypothetical protein
MAVPSDGRNNVKPPGFGKVVPAGWLWTFARRMLNFIRPFKLQAQERGVLAMIVARGHRSILISAALIALAAMAGLAILAGCEGVSDPATYPTPPNVPPPPYFFGIWGSGASDVYVVGQPGLIYHFDGASWSRQTSPTSVALTSVWGDTQSGRIYVTGHDGVILSSLGDGNWSLMSSGTGEDLYDVGEFLQMKYPNPAQTRHILAVGDNGTILRLVGGAWQTAPGTIMVRDNQNVPTDTLTVARDMVSLTSVFTYGVAGAYFDDRPVGGGEKGCVLLNDPLFDWQLRPIKGGESWVTSAARSSTVAENYVGTAAGRLFKMSRLADGTETFVEMYSPSLGEVVYGLWATPGDAVHAVSGAGRVTRVAADNLAHDELYYDGLTFFDVWGTSSADFYAIGINGRIMHYYDAPGDPAEPQWVREDVELPATKSNDGARFNKFDRPF